MASFNNVQLMGNLTREIDLRHTPSGTAVADLGIAVNEKYKNKAGETVEDVVFVDCVVWGVQAESAAKYLQKGAPLMIAGRLQLDTWETEAGEKRSKLRVRADRVIFTGAAPKKAPLPDESKAPAGPVGTEDDIPF